MSSSGSGSGAPPPPPPPKRIHEESASNEYHHSPFAEHQLDAHSHAHAHSRVAKLPRTTESRSPLHHQLYRMPPPQPSNNSDDPNPSLDFNWKPKRLPEMPSDIDSWRASRSIISDKQSPHEAVGENKLDFTSDKDNKKSERWERERKDKFSGMDNDKESLDTSTSRNPDQDIKERRKDRDADIQGDTHSISLEKEPGDGFMDTDGATEREREGFTSTVQQRKRMLRPKGSPQLPNRFRSRSRDNDESQGKPEVSTVVYKVGECMQDLIKLWKEYEASQSNRNEESPLNGPTLEICILAEYVTATNRQVRGGQLWGTDIYTDDSDLVAVLMHTGYCRPTASSPPSAIQELRATIRVLPPQECYTSTLRNNVRSRAWGAAIGCSYCVERCCIVKKGGGTIDLEPCLTHTSSVEPTLAPVAVERSMTTRAAASNALRQQRFVREVTIQYNLCNEPWIKYSISIVADKGLKKPLYTSARLKKGEVLYLETHSQRYELCFTGEKTASSITTSQSLETEKDKPQTYNAHEQNGERSTADRDMLIDVFRWSRCRKLLPQKIMRCIGIPLPLEYIEVLEENIDWEDVQWSQTGVWIGGKEYPLARVHFLSPN